MSSVSEPEHYQNGGFPTNVKALDLEGAASVAVT
jgi:hypothetical protein